MPLDVMLATVRTGWEHAQKQKDPDVKLALMRLVHADAAVAAPYCHPKLAAMQHTGAVDSAVTLTVLTGIARAPGDASDG